MSSGESDALGYAPCGECEGECDQCEFCKPHCDDCKEDDPETAPVDPQ